MSRPTRFEHNRYVGDKRTHLVHDLDQSTDACRIDDLMASGQFQAFGPDTPVEARNRGYGPCPRCSRAPADAPAGSGATPGEGVAG